MSLNYYKDETEKICKSKGWDRAEINKKEKGVDIMMEMGDVFSYLFQLAHMLNIDLDKMWLEHGKKMTHKKYISG